jgi:hypothetical protein
MLSIGRPVEVDALDDSAVPCGDVPDLESPKGMVIMPIPFGRDGGIPRMVVKPSALIAPTLTSNEGLPHRAANRPELERLGVCATVSQTSGKRGQ